MKKKKNKDIEVNQVEASEEAVTEEAVTEEAVTEEAVTEETVTEENDVEESTDESDLLDKESDKAIRKRDKKAEKKALKKASKKDKYIRKPEDVNIVRELLNLIVYIGCVVIACFLIITFVGQRTTVHGESMEPTLQSGNNLWIDKLSYDFSDPKRYDVIVFPYQHSDVYYIKRIIGLPGETVQIDANGYIYIDGKLLQEEYGLESISPASVGRAGNPITLGEDEYFVLGDNRNNSRDSRWEDVGNIKRDDIIGKAIFRLSPLNEFGVIDK